ncbi:MAG: 5'-3' exonuclease [Spirochaetales bacterium]|nr:5'-3' exonuclease [Spirochaetales bacterium]
MLLLVDGMNLWFQMFFGMPSRITNDEGKAIQGLMGFTGALLRIIRMTEPSHVIAVFDGEHHNPRTDIDSDYKANRQDYSDVSEEQNPFIQLPEAFRLLDLMGIRWYETKIHEADDVIASYVRKYRFAAEITICSHDSDFYQLIGDNVRILRYRGDNSIFMDEKALMDKYGITGSQYVDFKSLTGDHADNIRGVEGIGPKTASRLMKDYGTLDNLLQNYMNDRSNRIKVLMNIGKDRLPLNRSLITMKKDIPLPLEIDELAYSGKYASTRDVLTAAGLL